MSETKFTSGPWRAISQYHEVWAGETMIAEVVDRGEVEQIANTDLIAAAPTLYAALAALVDYTEQLERVAYPEVEREVEHRVMQLARRALAAALGEEQP